MLVIGVRRASLRARRGQCPLDGGEERRRRKGLGQERHARATRSGTGHGVAIAGDKQHPQIGTLGHQALGEDGTVHFWHDDIGQSRSIRAGSASKIAHASDGVDAARTV